MPDSQPPPPHPGTITFVDGATGKTTRVAKASEVPDEIKFVETERGLVPVTKIVASVHGNQRTIRQYGPDGQLLESTVQVHTDT